MANRKVKWLIYTVLVGLIPALLRILIWLISQNRDMGILNAVDFIVFGLILHISNINEVEHFDDAEKSWKTFQNGISIAFISFYSALLACHLLGEANPGLIDGAAIKSPFYVVWTGVIRDKSRSVQQNLERRGMRKC